MRHSYRHDNMHEAAPRPRSPKRNPSQAPPHKTWRDIPGNNSSTKIWDHSSKQTPHHDSDQSLLDMLSSTVACLKHKKMDLEALGCLEQSLWLKRRMFGVDSSAVHKALSDVMLSYNSVAMQYLAQGLFDQCLAMLRKAEAITAPGNFKRCQALQILTFNNIGCCYRKLGKLKSALKYLKEAAQIGSGSAHVKNLSITHLNLCAIQSQLGRHDLALEHAQAAIFHTQEELVSLEDGATDVRDEDGSKDRALVDALDPKTREEKIISLAVAYHNLAVELEFNGRGEASLQWYKKALQLVWKYRESNENLCESFKRIFLDAKKKQQTANVRQNGIPASVYNAVNGRRPLTRPRSAHAAARGTNEVDRADVSYSSTVASQCYKATKLSAAGLRYGSPCSAASTKPQRPASATTRPRPMSATPSSCLNTRESRDKADNAFEMHWKKLETEHALNDFPKTERSNRRPQSAGSITAAARRRHQAETQRQHQFEGQLYFAAQDEDLIGNDQDLGVLDDDGNSENEFDNDSFNSNDNQQERETASSQITDESVSTTGYSGDDDTDPELPAQRVCHMEYLRRMKKLAESIKDDLHGVGIRRATVDIAARSPTTCTDNVESVINDNESRVSTPRSATSKLRNRIEQARRDFCGEVERSTSKSNEINSSTLVTTKRNDDGLELEEDVHVFESERAARDAELQLFREAAGCRLQAFFRGQRCRTEVKQLKQAKRATDSAKLIQRQVRRYLEAQEVKRRLEEERKQLEMQREEVEDMAACLIQQLWRRVLDQNFTSANKSQHEDKTPSPFPQRRQFSIADAVLGSAVKRPVTSSRTLAHLRHPEPPHLNTAATVPHINLSHLQEPEAPRRSCPIPSLSDLDKVELPITVQAEDIRRSEVYDDDEEWKMPQQCSAPSTSRTKHTTPGCSMEQAKTPQQRSTVETSRTSDDTDQEADTRRQNVAAIRIQASIKSFVVRRRLALENAGDLSRIYIERKHFNVALAHALTLEQDFLEELSAIKLQAFVRGHQSRLLTECIKAGVDTAVNTIQRSFRTHRRHTQRAVDKGVRTIAARTIQQVFRDYEARRASIHQAAVDDELLSVQQIAASTIQTFWRQYDVARDHNLETIEAATCIQALGRGHLTRQSLKSLHGSSSEGLSKHSSAFSMSSSAERLVVKDSTCREKSLSINHSFLPPSIRELYMSSGSQVSSSNNQTHAQEIAELGLTFADFLRELETCTEVSVGSSALNAMRIVVETSPESTKTLANVVKVAQVLDRRLQEGFWTETIETSSIALLQAFRDVLDS